MAAAGALVPIGSGRRRAAAGLLTDLRGLNSGASGASSAPRRRPPRSVLLLGRAGCGTTSTLRDVAAGVAATDLRVAIVRAGERAAH